MSAHRIDTHHHIYPPSFLNHDRARVTSVAAGIEERVLEWTPARAIEAMDAAGIATAVTSISAPGVYFGAATARLARECNDYAAKLRHDHPGRFGIFAALPLPEVDASLREIEYAFDVLQADGVGLVTNVADLWPGDPRLAPVFDELDRRAAVVYFHPTAADCCFNILPGVGPATLEFPFDTTRAIVSLLANGTLARCRNIKWLFSHGCGTLPMLASRIASGIERRNDAARIAPHGVMAEIKRLHTDIVSAANPIAFDATRKLLGIERLLYGTDYPFWPADVTGNALAKLALDPADLRRIERDNALALLPGLARPR